MLAVAPDVPNRQDAGQEVRAPLGEIFAAIETRGYFLTTSGFRFPNTKWNHPASFRHWGISPDPATWRPLRSEVSVPPALTST